jgi:hypothetical protein
MPSLFETSVESIRQGTRTLGPSVGPTFGWEFLYCPSSLLSERSRLWFIGINPGGPGGTSKAAKECFEDGNAYYVDRKWSPDGEVLRDQVKEFFKLLAGAVDSGRLTGEGLLNETLTSNFCPITSDTWRTVTERRKALDLSRKLWSGILKQLSPRVIIGMGGLPYREFCRLYRQMGYALLNEWTIDTGWGVVDFRLGTTARTGRSPGSSTCRTFLKSSSCDARIVVLK